MTTNISGEPSTSTLLFPELILRDELAAILKAKLNKIGANVTKVDRMSEDELLNQAKKLVMPRPQRNVSYSFIC